MFRNTDVGYMMKTVRLFFWLIPLFVSAQEKVKISGRVTDENLVPIEGAHVVAGQAGEVTDAQGFFSLHLNPGEYLVKISHIAYEPHSVRLTVQSGNPVSLHIRLKLKSERIAEVVISGKSRKEREGAVKIDRKVLEVVPVITPGVKNILLSLPSVTQLDELSAQYLVRGGNYDENAVYINGIEVFRPFLTRSGRHEGLSIINSDLVENLHFYAGGFPVNKGNKLSSVLDITYREPKENSYKFTAGFTGGSFAFFRKGTRLKTVGGIRYLNNTLLVKSLEGNAEFRPSFSDFSLLTTYQASKRWRHEWLAYLSFNDYHFVPFSKQTNFGTFADSRVLVIHYGGREKDRFYAQFTALKSQYTPSDKTKITWINSFYHSYEREYFDILASYFIGEPNTDLSDENYGDPTNLTALGQQFDHARNDLDALIYKTLLTLNRKKSANFSWEAGISLSYEDIRDRIREYQIIDSAGFSVLPPYSTFHPNEPYQSDTLPVVPFMRIASDRLTSLYRQNGYVQVTAKTVPDEWKWTLTAGMLAGAWQIVNHTNRQQGNGISFSPRILITAVPQADTRHHFRLTAGLYMQPPAYREFRNFEGKINPDIKAQKAWNLSVAHEMTFHWKNFPFKLTSEIYYRYLYDVNPYKIENIRIRYAAKNNAVAYAYGAELRLYAELLPETPSWLSLAYMKTEENIEGRGFIPRPTDQRFKMGLMFQDYVPGLPFLKMYLNNIFATGMPTGAPIYADPYDFQFRTRNYWRTDIGLYYELTENPRFKNIGTKFDMFSIGMEIINTFDRRNSVSNLWVREIYSKRMMGVPNYMTGRIFNLKIKAAF